MTTEQHQIENNIHKNFPEQVAVMSPELQKVFCHQCTKMTEIKSKEYAYKFASGLIVYFCNDQEKNSWMVSNHLIS
jgi:hypothetical protein